MEKSANPVRPFSSETSGIFGESILFKKPPRGFRFAWVYFLLFLAAVFASGGCASPTATIDLIAVGRSGLASARQAQLQNHDDLVARHKAQLSALDTAFDSDVRLAAAGGIKNSKGEPVALTPEWVISARRGYTAVRNIMAQQMQKTQTAHTTQLDNIKAADEALEMAGQLTVMQWNISEQFKQQFMKLVVNKEGASK